MKKCARFLLFVLLAFCVRSAAAQDQALEKTPESRAEITLSFAPLVKKTAPAVVNIYTRKALPARANTPLFADPFFQQFFGQALPQGLSRKRVESALGSGVIVGADGVIVTSNHVIAGADAITVVLSDRREFDAQLQVADEKTDLAVLRIDPKGEVLPFLAIKDSDETQVGDLVLAIGNPFGVGQTVTSGIISATARTNVDITDINYFIQTDAAINPGNSGGALVTMDGKLTGINSAIFSRAGGGNMGLGFAVPSNMVRAIVEGGRLGHKKLVRSWTGVRGQTVTNEIAASLGLGRPAGMLVKSVHPASPAAQAGVRVGDIILSVNGREIEDASAFTYRIATQPLGSDVKLGVLQNGMKSEIAVRLIAPPETPARDETQITGINPFSGALVANLSPAVIEAYNLSTQEEKGVVLVSVGPGSVAQRLRFSKGDVILKVNGREVATVRGLMSALSKPPARGWALTLKRDGEMVDVLVR